MLEGLLRAGLAGSGGMAVVEGGAGLGKSRLVRWSTARAAELGATVLSARGGDLEGEFAFGVVLQLFTPWLARASRQERAQAFSGAAGLASSLFDPDDWERGHPPKAEQGLFHGLHWLTANLAERTPVHLSVDDAHWADEPSLRFLRYLAQRVDDLPVSVVVTSRPAPGGPGAAELSSLAAHPLARRVELAALSRDAAGALLRASLAEADGAFSEVVWEVTGGNPLFLHEFVRAVRDGDIEPRPDEVRRLARLSPRSISRHVLVRLARLGGAARALAGALAVLGDGTPLLRAAALADLDTGTAGRAADALVAEEIVTVAPGELLSFAHPLVREAVDADLAPVARGRSHLRAARLLAQEGAGAEEAAAHLLVAPVAGDPFAVEALVRAAGHAVERGAPGNAVRYLRRALEEPLEPGRHAELLVELARGEVEIADPQAVGHLEEALATLADPVARGRALMTLGRALEERGLHADAAGAFEQAAGPLDEDDQLAREAMAAYARAASTALVPEAFVRIQRVVERRPGDETAGERSLLALLAAQRTFAGAPREEAVGLARRAWAGGRLLDDEGPEGRSWSVATGALTWNDEFALSEQIGSAALEAARASGSAMAHATASFCLAMPAAGRGRLLEALAHTEAALAARREGWETYPFACTWVACNAHLDRGELGEAEALLAILDEPGRADSADRAFALDARGRVRLIQGRAAEALEDQLAAGRMLAPVTESPTVVPWKAGAALAAWRLGREELARELARSGLESARATGAPRAVARFLQTVGLIEGGPGGLAMLEEAVAVAGGADLPIEEAWASLALGAAIRRSGERVRAREPLARALHLASRRGASLVARRAEEELRAAGARPRRVVLTGVDALTPGELRVARMAAEGLTNREIAQALFVTVHAIDKHLRAAYDKLGIGSRKELARVLDPGKAPAGP